LAPFFLAQSARDTTSHYGMDENTILSLLESISSSEPLRKKFLEALRDPVQQNDVTDRQQRDPTRDQSGDTVTTPPCGRRPPS